MTINLLLITHEQVGHALLKAVSKTFGELPLPAKAIPVRYGCDPEDLVTKLRQLIKHFDKDDDMLVLTDVPGSTPCKIAQKFSHLCPHDHVKVITGINLPMLMRIMNYPALSLNQLAQKALSGGKAGIVSMENSQ